MARKKKHEEHVNHERWLVSYADFITLLFATFTALFAMSNADKAKLQAAAKSIKQAFAEGSGSLFATPTVKTSGGGGGDNSIVIEINPLKPASAAKPAQKGKASENEEEGESEEWDNLFQGISLKKGMAEEGETPVDDGGKVTPTPTPTPADGGGSIPMGSEGGGTEALAAEIKELMQNVGLEKVVEVRQEKRGTVISLGEAAFFAPGEISVLPSCTHQLDRIVNALRNKSFEIRVEGHTDSTPVRSGRYRDNWELSSLRAASIVHFMEQEYKFDPKALSAAGYGESRPLVANDTHENRQKNRRVDIVILNERARTLEPH